MGRGGLRFRRGRVDPDPRDGSSLIWGLSFAMALAPWLLFRVFPPGTRVAGLPLRQWAPWVSGFFVMVGFFVFELGRRHARRRREER